MYCRYIGISTQRLGQTATKSDIRQNQSFIQSKFENQAGRQSGRRHKIRQNSLESFGDQRQNSGQTLKNTQGKIAGKLTYNNKAIWCRTETQFICMRETTRHRQNTLRQARQPNHTGRKAWQENENDTGLQNKAGCDERGGEDKYLCRIDI